MRETIRILTHTNSKILYFKNLMISYTMVKYFSTKKKKKERKN